MKAENTVLPPIMYRTRLSRRELEEYAANDLAFYEVDISRISTIFLDWVYYFYISRFLNTFTITREIKILDGGKKASKTKGASCFRSKNSPLNGLMHKHFSDARFTPGNLLSQISSKRGKQRLLNGIEEIFLKNKSGMMDEETINKLSHLATVVMHEERSADNALTGEWIVYQEHEGNKY